MRALVTTFLLVAAGAHSWAQVPAGDEFQVNTFTTDRQLGPWPAVDADGNFVIVWDGRQQGGTGPGGFGQRYAADGVPIGTEFRANEIGAADRTRSAFGKGGSFLVTWAAPGLSNVMARLFLADATPAGPEFRVNITSGGYQYRQAVTSLRNGEFVVAWYSAGRIAARRIGRNGAPVGAEFIVSPPGQARTPDVASWQDGFVIVWRQSVPQGTDILGRRFDAAGRPVGDYFRANTVTGALFDDGVAVAESGAFVVVWNDLYNVQYYGIRARLFTPQGTPVGVDFRVNTSTAIQVAFPHMAADGLGNFVVAWTLLQPPNSEVLARRFDASGAPRGDEFSVNTYTTSNQVVGVPADDGVGNFVISWYSQGQDGNLYGAFAQRFGGLRPSAVDVDTAASPSSDANRVLEPGETVDVRPSWRNLNGAAQAFAGVLTSLTGPAGPTYAITDGAADYGTVPNGSAAPCLHCYAVSVSAPPVRPAVHWDATAVESITPDAHGQRKGWRLHVGESFTDVPRASLYYRFVETLLHNGVTAGCSGSSYCPQSSSLREQMPVFVLVAREGPGYTPPACTTPLFADVPPGSPFCPWIEELARRGVVGGCGGGNYCASSPVTREQMPVFVLRTLDPALNPPDCTTPMFSDVPADSPFCRWIEELARRGVLGGCGGGRFCPLDAVTREQMGVFISQGFGLQLYAP